MPAELLGEGANQFPPPKPQQGQTTQNLITTVQPGNPAATASAVFVMMGLAILFTPRTTGRLRIAVQCTLGNTTTADGATLQISYGTGAAPANGAAVTGTQTGQPVTYTSLTGVLAIPVFAAAIVIGLIVNTQYWIDIALKVVTGGSASITVLNIIVEEV